MKKLLFRFGQILCLLFFVLMLLESSLVSMYAKEGLLIWASCVLPLLFPFILLSKFWIRYKIPELFFSQAKRLLPACTDLAVSLPVFFLGLCSGFPVGAIFIAHYYQTGMLEKQRAEYLLPLASFVSPMFIMGYIRSQLHLQGARWVCYVFALYFPVFLCYLLMQFLTRKNKNEKISSKSPVLSRKKTAKSETYFLARHTLLPSLTEDIWIPSLEIIFIIGIYMMIFSVLSGMLTRLPLFCGPAFTFLLANLEVTTGFHALATSGLYSPEIMYALSAAAASFGGICTMAQVQTAISDTDLSLKKYVKIKLITAMLSFILCWFFF